MQTPQQLLMTGCTGQLWPWSEPAESLPAAAVIGRERHSDGKNTYGGAKRSWLPARDVVQHQGRQRMCRVTRAHTGRRRSDVAGSGGAHRVEEFADFLLEAAALAR